MQLAASTDNRKFCLLTDNLKDVWEDVIGGLLSTLNSPDPLLDAVPANGSDGPHCLPVPLCLKRMQVLQRNQDPDCYGIASFYWTSKLVIGSLQDDFTLHTFLE